ncbi:MAG: Fe-S protein assembly co-chaperone HscB [Hydrogenophilales bacterium 16-64-46]|nr:MAG: Fe-S protein assembly co-chaperone HscB [Hydrogenophilales bacterium 12-64-13]OYZ04948.1 MAG: Fe-S protein assembly co-chaperone HscB [Hydrogenophilales bacterium 16-64-46]OZA37591.1 MAG: Fe-S protein assembly co-chaperone HscB [Hydrogenophilales bacterium 17-64-34]HQT00860.1 Fe-S protein assembly co-chaperone HscB [Thiobacillus sp.]
MQSHFDLFHLPATYAIDRDKLDVAYRELQNTVHPDRFAAKTEAEQRVAMQWATQANEAYQTLKHPVNRGVYLLKLQGIDALDAMNTQMAPAFLMQQMEWREAIDDARAAKSVAALDSLTAELRAAHRRIEAELGVLLDDAKDLDAARETVRQLRFMDKLLAEVGEVYEDIEA